MPLGSVKTSSQAADKVNFSAKRQSARFAQTYGAVGIPALRLWLRGCPPLPILRKFAKDPAPVWGLEVVEIQTAPGVRCSVPKLLVAVFRHGFMVVASLTQSLPVVGVPEQSGVAAMRNDVVNHSSLDQSARPLASGAQRMGVEERGAGFLPAASVSLLGGGLSVVCVERSMLLTVHPAVGDQPTAAGMLAGDVRTARHGQPPPPVSSRFMKHTLLSYVRARGKDRSRVRQRKRTQEAVASGSLQSLRF